MPKDSEFDREGSTNTVAPRRSWPTRGRSTAPRNSTRLPSPRWAAEHRYPQSRFYG